MARSEAANDPMMAWCFNGWRGKEAVAALAKRWRTIVSKVDARGVRKAKDVGMEVAKELGGWWWPRFN